MIKLFCLFLLSLLSYGRLAAQTDTTKPLSAPGTPVLKTPDSLQPAPVHHPVHRDTTHRRDSTRRKGDSLRSVKVRQLTHDDSLVRQELLVQAAGSARDSIARRDSLAAAAVVAHKVDGPSALLYWKAVLAANPSFNFTGAWVVEPFQIHQANSKDSLFYLIVGILFYFALIRIFFEKYFGNLMTLFFRVSLRQQQIREQVLQTPLPSLLMNILFIITGGLYSCYLLHYSRFGANINFWLLYLDCIAGLSVIYLVKFLVLKFCGWVFNISRATDTYIFVVFLVNKMLGLFLLPFLIIITFSGPEVREIFITISLVMVFVLLAYRVLAAYRPVRNEIKLTPFHFFLYLCAFEIAPLLLIYKVLLSYLEKVY